MSSIGPVSAVSPRLGGAPVAAPAPPAPAALVAPRPSFVVSIDQLAAAQRGPTQAAPASATDQDPSRATQPAGVLQAGGANATATPELVESAVTLGAVRVDASASVKQGSVATPAHPGRRPASPEEAPRLDLSI